MSDETGPPVEPVALDPDALHDLLRSVGMSDAEIDDAASHGHLELLAIEEECEEE